MRGAEKLFDAITEVREDLVEEALDYRFQAKKAVPWQRYAKWAACLALVVCIGYLAANLDLRRKQRKQQCCRGDHRRHG